MMDWLQNLGGQVYDWAGNNPMDALSLGIGAAGTGMGIYDQYRANKQADDRRKLAEQFSRQGPAGSMPNWSPEQLQAMYFRPASHFMAERGQTQGGAFTQALADAALKAEGDRNQIGNQWFNSRVNALGQGQPVPASGSVGAFGSAMQNYLLRKSLAGSPMGVGRNLVQEQPGATWGGSFQGGDNYDRTYSGQPFDYSIPGYQLYSGGMNLPGQGQQYSLTNPFGVGQTAGMPGAGSGDQRWGLSPFSAGGTHAQNSGVPGFYPEEFTF